MAARDEWRRDTSIKYIVTFMFPPTWQETLSAGIDDLATNRPSGGRHLALTKIRLLLALRWTRSSPRVVKVRVDARLPETKRGVG